MPIFVDNTWHRSKEKYFNPHNTEAASSRPDDVAVILFCLLRLDQRVREYSLGDYESKTVKQFYRKVIFANASVVMGL